MTDTEIVPVTVTGLDGEPVEVLMGADVAYITEYTGLTYRQIGRPKVEQRLAFCGIISGTARCINTKRSLTRSLDLGEEGLAMQATRKPRHAPRKARQRPSRATRQRCIEPGCKSFPALPDLGLCKGHITTELTGLSLDQFEARIAEMFSGWFTIAGDCWEYCGNRMKGYGRISVTVNGKWRVVFLNNYILKLRLGRKVSYGALHKCDNPPCFRPGHLYEGSAKQNSADRAERGRAAAGPTHGNTKLTPEQVREIVARYEPGHDRWHRGNAYLLAAEFGITKSYVLMIVKRGHWSLRYDGEKAA